MSDTETPEQTEVQAEQTEVQAEPTEVQAEQPDGQAAEQTGGTANREAAKYRRQLRAAETREAVKDAIISEFNREHAERLAAERLADPSDLWDGGVELDGLLDRSGKLDAASVEAAVTELLDRKPHLARRGPQAPPASTVTGDGKPPAPGGGQSWAEALRPSHSRV